MRLLTASAILLTAAACGPFGGSPAPGGHATGPPAPTAAAPGPAGPAAVLLQLATQTTYAVSLVFADGRVIGPVTARLRTFQPLVRAAPAALPVLSASDSRVYYLDGDTDVQYLARDGARGSAARVPGGPRVQSGFAVSPDDRRIAVAAMDASADPVTTTLSVEGLSGGDRVALSTGTAQARWPVGWHAGGLVVALGSARTQTVAANPYGTFSGYQVLDPTTGARRSSIECTPAGPLTPAGTACMAGGVPLSVVDFAGRARSLGAVSNPVVAAAEAPDGARVASCCAGGQLQIWDLGDGSVSSLGEADAQSFGWIDATHLVVAEAPGQRPRVVDVTTGATLPVQAQGRVVARVPGGL